MYKLIILGNAGSGKSTLAKKLMARSPAVCLSLDEVAFESGAVRQPLADSIADARRFIANHDSWIVEGCYGDIVEPILGECEELVFLNPGLEVCVAHCRARPWEPEKFGSREEQDKHLDNLIAWIAAYEMRQDEYGLVRHRQLYEAFTGKKRELNHPDEYADV